MVTIKTFRDLAISFEGTHEEPHFERTSFRVKKKIFATLDEKNKRACLKLSEIEQDIFSTIDKKVIYPVPNKWGKQGWTFIELPLVKKEIVQDALSSAYNNVVSQQGRKY